MSTKQYDESNALSLLNDYLDFDKTKFSLLDRPDLQSPTLSIGIEVTQGISTEDGIINNFVSKNFTRQLSIEEKKELLLKFKCKASIIDLGGVHILVPDDYLSPTAPLEKISHAIDRKIDKLNKEGYTIFDTMYLFIYSFNCNNEWEIRNVLDIVNKSLDCNKKLYDSIFIDTYDFIHVCELKECKYTLSRTIKK